MSGGGKTAGSLSTMGTSTAPSSVSSASSQGCETG